MCAAMYNNMEDTNEPKSNIVGASMSNIVGACIIVAWRLELAAYGIDATAAIEHARGGAIASATTVVLVRHREAHHAREVALRAVLRGAHGDLDADPTLGTLPSERRGHGARAPARRHALHASPRYRQRVASTAALREPRQRHGGAELLTGVERRGPDPRVPARVHARRAVEPKHGGEVVRDG